MKQQVVIGCDIGTGSCKAVAYDNSGNIVKDSQVFYEVQHPQENYSEQDPELIIQSFITCISSLISALSQKPLALSLSSCMHSLMAVDKDGKSLTSLITWEDSRSYKIAMQVRNSPLGRKIYKRTGTPVHSMAPIYKIAWFQKNEKQIFNKTFKFIGIKEYLWYRLFEKFEIDYSIASATGLFNIKNLSWERSALDFCGISPAKLSHPVNTSFMRTGVSREFLQKTGLPAEIKVCIGASDGCLANVGSHISGKGNAALTIGTSAAVRINSPTPIIDFKSMIFNYILDKKTFVSGGPMNNGGNVIKWIIKEILGNDEPSEADFNRYSEEISKIDAGSNGLLCLPYFFGERAPVWDEKAAAIWFGIKVAHTKYHLFRAAQEGISYCLKMILDDLEKQSSPIHTLYASGGFINSKEWVQLLADITGKKIVINERGDASSIGAAIWAMRALKIKPMNAKKIKKQEVILPNHETRIVYRKQFAIFKKIYPLTKEQIHQLHS